MNTELIKQKINNLIELRKSVITGIIVVIGGLGTLFINLDSLTKTVLFIGGLILLVFLLFIMGEIGKELRECFKNMEEEE